MSFQDQLSMLESLAEVSPELQAVWDEAVADQAMFPYLILSDMTYRLYEIAQSPTTENAATLERAVKILSSAWKQDADGNTGIRNMIDLQFIETVSTADNEASKLLSS